MGEDITVNVNVDIDRLGAVLAESIAAALVKAAPALAQQLGPQIGQHISRGSSFPMGTPADDGGLIEIPVTPLDNEPGEHNVHFVSRHDIAEVGLRCPACKKIAAKRGDYSLVRESVLKDGTFNEVILCPNVYKNKDGFEVECGAYLLASPDTEHGDHLDPEDCGKGEDDANLRETTPGECYLFKRISKADAAREQFGDDVTVDGQGRLTADADLAIERLHPEEDSLVSVEEQFKHTVPGYGESIEGPQDQEPSA